MSPTTIAAASLSGWPTDGVIEELKANYPQTAQRTLVAPEPVAPRSTPTMPEAAAASDMREAFPSYYDEEAARPLPTLHGRADLALASD